MNAVTTPNLKAFTTDLPKTRIGILRLLWPTIQACLEAGHSLRDVHEKLQLDGVEMAYSTLCWAVARIRHAGLPTAGRAQNSPGQTVQRRAPLLVGVPEAFSSLATRRNVQPLARHSFMRAIVDCSSGNAAS